MIKQSLTTLLLSLLVIVVFPFNTHRPDRLLTIARSIDDLVPDSLLVSRRDYQCYITTRGRSLKNGFTPVHIRRWCLGNQRIYYSDDKDKNAQYDSIIQQSMPFLIPVIEVIDQNHLLFVEITRDYIFGATTYDRKGQTCFLYPRGDMSIGTIDSLIRDCMDEPLDAITINGDEHLRYMIVP